MLLAARRQGIEMQLNIKFCVDLSQSGRDQLDELLSGRRQVTRKIKRAQILAANDGVSDEVIAATTAALWVRRTPAIQCARRPRPRPLRSRCPRCQAPHRQG
jgi:hypothetical protein